jgi:hypothetical protein
MPVMGIDPVGVPAFVLVGIAVSVICSVARMVPMGVDGDVAGKLHAPKISMRNSATNQSLRETIFISWAPLIVL